MARTAKKRRPEPWEKGWDRLLEVPEGYVGEFVNGELVMMPRPNPPHMRAASALGALLGAAFQFGNGGPGGWLIFDEPRIAFDGDIRVPDLGGWRVERFHAEEEGPILVIPDWVCEVLSPRTAADDRTEKMPLYARHGVKHSWLIDPIVQTLEVYRLEAGHWVLVGAHAGAARVRAEPFAALELDLGLLWGPRSKPEGPRAAEPTAAYGERAATS